MYTLKQPLYAKIKVLLANQGIIKAALMLWCADRNKESWEFISVLLMGVGRGLGEPAHGPLDRPPTGSSRASVTGFASMRPSANVFPLSEGDFRDCPSSRRAGRLFQEAKSELIDTRTKAAMAHSSAALQAPAILKHLIGK